jgi:hypothetical protein
MAKPDLIRREEALSKTLAKYSGKPFVWGEVDCVRMLRSHLVAMGHRKVPKVPQYDTALGAKKALKAAGFKSVEAMLDSLLPRISPAQALPGDVLVLQGEEGLDAVMVSVGYKAAGWQQEVEGMAIVIPLEIKGAWRG